MTSADQRSSALAAANEVRAWRKQRRSEIRREPRAGVVEIQEPHEYAGHIRLFDLLLSMFARTRDQQPTAEIVVRRVCRVCDVDSSTRLAQLTQRQRYALATELARRGL